MVVHTDLGTVGCFLQQHWPELFTLAGYDYTEHSNHVHLEDPSASCCGCRDGQSEPVPGPVGFVVHGVA